MCEAIRSETSDKPIEIASYGLMRQCPRFEKCSAPICPLDLLQDRRDVLPGEPRCKLSKNRRFSIGEGSDLPLQGLTRREWAAKKRWEAKSEDEKQSVIKRLKSNR